jgi:hypothetical protein
MKRLLLLLFSTAFFITSAHGQLKFGAGINLLNDIGIQGKVHNVFSETIAGQGSFTLFFSSGATIFNIDLDAHYYAFDLGDLESFALTPFAGINIFSSSGENNSGRTDIGLNLGINGTLQLTETLELYVEPRIVINNGTDFGLAAGVYF